MISLFEYQSGERLIFIKIIHLVLIMVFGGVTYDGDVINLPTWPQTDEKKGLNQVAGEGSAYLDREGGC